MATNHRTSTREAAAAGEAIGNSWLLADLIDAFCRQWNDDALAARDARSRKTENAHAAIDNFNFSGMSSALELADEGDNEFEGKFKSDIACSATSITKAPILDGLFLIIF